jgi:hypothetical protein
MSNSPVLDASWNGLLEICQRFIEARHQSDLFTCVSVLGFCLISGCSIKGADLPFVKGFSRGKAWADIDVGWIHSGKQGLDSDKFFPATVC